MLVAGLKNKLDELREELESQFNVDSAQRIFAQTESQSLQIDTLINNPDFGSHVLFHERELADEQVNMVIRTNLIRFYG